MGKNVEPLILLSICSGIPVGVLKHKHLSKVIKASGRYVAESNYAELNKREGLTHAESRYRNILKKYVKINATSDILYMPASFLRKEFVNTRYCATRALQRALGRLVEQKLIVKKPISTKTIVYGIKPSSFFAITDYFQRKHMLPDFMKTHYFVSQGLRILQREIYSKLEAQRTGMGYYQDEFMKALLASPTFVETVFLHGRRDNIYERVLRLPPSIRAQISTADLIILSSLVLDLVNGKLDIAYDELIEQYFQDIRSHILQHQEILSKKTQGGSRQSSSRTKSYRSPKKTLRKDALTGI